MNDKIINVIEDLKRKGYFKYNYTDIKRFNKRFNAFDVIGENIFYKVLYQDYNLTGAEISDYTLKIISKLPVFPFKRYNKYQEYMRAKNEPSFKMVLKRFMNTAYKENQNKKTSEPVSFDINYTNISNIELMQSLINNDVFINNLNISADGFYQYDSDNETFIKVTKENFGEIIGIENKNAVDYLFRDAIMNKHRLTHLNNFVYAFQRSRKRDLIMSENKADAKYITNLINKFKVVS